MSDIALTNGHGPQIGEKLPLPAVVRGVYLLWDGDECVYVGQSNHIASRVCEHQKTGKAFDAVTYFEVPEGSMDEVEAELMFRFEPKYNGVSTWKGRCYYPESSRRRSRNRRNGIFDE